MGSRAKVDRAAMTAPAFRLLMTVDSVGGVWRYAIDLAQGLGLFGFHTVFAGLGPQPSAAQRAEAESVGALRWLDAPLDWTAEREAELDALPAMLKGLVDEERIDIVHLNLPSQAYGLEVDVPVVTVSHSCVPTWFRGVRGENCPPPWNWQEKRNRSGFARADAVLAPSRSHARLMEEAYGPIRNLSVAMNAALPQPGVPTEAREPFVLAAGRWWDEGKNGSVLDDAARLTAWPVRMAGALQGPNGQRTALRHAEALGEAPSAQMRALMARAGIFVSPSVYEPFGLAALEAAFAGTPLVLSDIPTYRELWDEAALFAAPRDPESFAEAINRLAGDLELRARMGGLARERAQEYAPEKQIDAVLAAYRAAGLHAAERRQAA